MQLSRGLICSEAEGPCTGWLGCGRMALLLLWLTGWLADWQCCAALHAGVSHLADPHGLCSALLDSLYGLAD